MRISSYLYAKCSLKASLTNSSLNEAADDAHSLQMEDVSVDKSQCPNTRLLGYLKVFLESVPFIKLFPDLAKINILPYLYARIGAFYKLLCFCFHELKFSA